MATTETLPVAQTFSCQYCYRRFKRLEHAQRHERTHTKEAPYKCPCGRAFPRRDLLRRHEKSAHNRDIPKRTRTSNNQVNNDTNGVKHRSVQNQAQSQPNTNFLPLNTQPSNISSINGIPPHIIPLGVEVNDSSQILENQTIEFSSPNQVIQQHTIEQIPNQSNQLVQLNQHSNGQQNETIQQEDFQATGVRFDFPALDPFDLFGDTDGLFDNVDFSSYFLPPEAGFDQNGNLEASLPINEQRKNTQSRSRNGLSLTGRADPQSFSRFGSPLPSILPDSDSNHRDSFDQARTSTKSGPCWKISATEYNSIKESIANIAHVLPKDFNLPSRHTMSRFLEGCIKGLYHHMPFVHLPTFSATNAAPDLLLAMIAIGAQFRFEMNLGVILFYAAKAAIMHQIHARNDGTVIEMLSHPPSLEVGSISSGPRSARDSQSAQQHGSESSDHRDDHDTGRLQTIQAILSLMVMGSWGPKQLVGEAITFQSLLAVLLREDGLNPDSDVDISDNSSLEMTWRLWVRIESLRRTKIFSFAFINLQSVAYNVPPSILTSEVKTCIPVSAEEWYAENAQRWSEARDVSEIQSLPFSTIVQSLFRTAENSPDSQPIPAISSIGNYALIFTIHQCIFFLRQGHFPSELDHGSNKLYSQDMDKISRCLQAWQAWWETSPESSIEPQSSSGPVAFNSTALLRLAWIRLHSDLGPCRSLSSRDPTLIVEAFKTCPGLQRNAALIPAVLHASHALLVPVRLGIKFVAKTQTVSWSVQHSMCNLECAIFLSKWFEAIATTILEAPLTSQEKGLINMIRSMVLETGFFRDEAFEPASTDNDIEGWQRQIRHLGTAVATLWAEIFSGTHVFDLVSMIGTSLNIYARQLEDSHTPIHGS